MLLVTSCINYDVVFRINYGEFFIVLVATLAELVRMIDVEVDYDLVNSLEKNRPVCTKTLQKSFS